MLTKKSLPAALCAALVLLLAACSSGSDDEAPSDNGSSGTSGGSTPVAQPTTAAPGAQPTPQATGGSTGGGEFGPIANAVSALRSFRAQVTTEAGGSKLDVQLEWVAPNRQHITLNGASLGIPGNVEMITIGSDVYTKLGPSWTRQSLPGGGGFDPNTLNQMVEAVKNLGNSAVKGATATVNGKSCQIYTARSGTATNEFCIADNLPLRIVSESAGTKMTIVFADYNANININPPI